jgi:3-hydroxybutyryl-CoA dehydrogenase
LAFEGRAEADGSGADGRSTSRPDGEAQMKVDDIQRILIVGAGTMGGQIGLQCALHGLDVVVFDSSPEALAAAGKRLAAYVDDIVGGGFSTAEAGQAALGRVRFEPVLDRAAADVDLVSESVPEEPALKGRVFAQLDAVCPARTVFTTNTSTLLPSMLARATGRPSRFAALHFHLPVWVANVADVMGHPGTDRAVIDLLAAFAERIGQIPVVLEKEHSGYVFNTMLNALSGAALELVADGVTTAETVDRAWMAIMKTPVGPLGILDRVGLDTVWRIVDFWAGTLDDERLRANADLLKRYVDAGHLGVKTGRGFYEYPDPAYQRPDFVTGPRAAVTR